MGRNLTIAFFGLVVVIGVCYLLVSTGGGANEAEMAKLRQRDAKRRAAAQEADRRSKTDLALLAKQGRGQELPDYLVSEIDREANFWFVGKPDSVAGVQIPFAPGSLPLPPAITEPLNPNPGFWGQRPVVIVTETNTSHSKKLLITAPLESHHPMRLRVLLRKAVTA